MEWGGELREPVLIVDPDDQARHRVCEALHGLSQPRTVIEAAETKSMLRSAGHAALVLLDADLTDVEMVDALALLRERHPDLPVIVLCARHDPDRMRRALEMGAASYARKQSPAHRLCAVVEAALRGHPVLDADLVAPSLYRYEALLEGARARDRAIIESLAAAVEAKDRVTSRHVHQVAELAVLLARLVDPCLADSEDFLFGCVLHDVGKIGVPEWILNKPGPLTSVEWDVMRLHPETGARVIRPLGLSRTVKDIVMYHHERWDGSGYPVGLAGTAIPLPARIFAVCDALEAMTAPRPYREALAPEEALRRIQDEAGGQFDPAVVTVLDQGLASGAMALHPRRERRPLFAGACSAA